MKTTFGSQQRRRFDVLLVITGESTLHTDVDEWVCLIVLKVYIYTHTLSIGRHKQRYHKSLHIE